MKRKADIAKPLPTVLITAVPQLAAHGLPIYLRSVEPEAQDVQKAYGGSEYAMVQLNARVEEIDAALEGMEVWWFAGHGDAPLHGQQVPVFHCDGELQSVSITALAEMIRRHTPPNGNVRLVVLMGCCTYDLGRALQKQACVPYVVCWRTRLHDRAGHAFGRAFAEAMAAGSTPQLAFDAACIAVEKETEHGWYDNGLEAQVPAYKLFEDPANKERVYPTPLQQQNICCPLSICSEHFHAARLRAFAPKARRGRLAAGTPELLDGSAPTLADVPPSAPPLAACATYVPRTAETQRVASALCHPSAQVCIALTGQGGVGKTVLAAASLADPTVRVHFRDGLIWSTVGLRGEKRLDALLATVAKEVHALLPSHYGVRSPPSSTLDSHTSAAWIAQCVHERALRCLVVLDDVWEVGVVQAFMASGLTLLVTTRLKEVAIGWRGTINTCISSASGCFVGGSGSSRADNSRGPEVDCIEIRCMDPEGPLSQQMLACAAGLNHAQSDNRELPHHKPASVLLAPGAEEVLQACGGLPLALAMVGALCRAEHEGDWTSVAAAWRDSKQALEQNPPHDDMTFDPAQANRDWSLQATVRMSIVRLSPEVQRAYASLALAPKRVPLPEDLLFTLFGALDNATAASWREKLIDHSLLMRMSDGSCMVHDVQLDYLRCTGPPAGATDRLFCWLNQPTTLDRLTRLPDFKYTVMSLWRELKRHTGGNERMAAARALVSNSALAESLPSEENQAMEERANASKVAAREPVDAVSAMHKTTLARMHSAADLLVTMDQPAAAFELYERALAMKKAMYGSQHAVIAVTLEHMGAALVKQGHMVRAIELYQQALSINEKAFGMQDTRVATTLKQMGVALVKLDRISEALRLYERALTIDEALHGPTHTEVAVTLKHLGYALVKQDALAEAIDLYKRALAIDESACGSQHVSAATTLNNLGFAMAKDGRLAEAMPLHRRALAIYEAVYGPSHTEVASTLKHMGSLLTKQNHLAQAIELYRRTLSIREAVHGPLHSEVGTVLRHMGVVLVRQGQLDKAMTLFERALKIKETAYGPQHSEVATTLGNMADVLVRLGQTTEALGVYKRALAIDQVTLGAEHTSVAITLCSMADVLTEGLPHEAMVLYDRALAIFNAALREGHPRIANCVRQRQLCLEAGGVCQERTVGQPQHEGECSRSI